MKAFEQADKATRNRRIVLIAVLVIAAIWHVSCWDRIPPIEGCVVDARTGAPIAGVLVQKWLYQPPRFDFFDTRSEQWMRGSFAETRSDEEGRFRLPGMWGFRTVAMGWMVWAPGYMPERNCFKSTSWRRAGECPGGMGFFGIIDPWVQAIFTEKGDTIEMEVRLFPPTMDGVTFYRWDRATNGPKPFIPEPGTVDPWGEYFRRLRVLAEERRLPEESFFQEARQFLGQYPATEGILREVAQVEGLLGGYRGDTRCYKADLAGELLKLRERGCAGHPDWRPCSPDGLARRRSFLERDCGVSPAR